MTASATPRPAGTIVLARDGGEGLELLMIRRGRQMAFMAGAYAFPGGRAEEDDPGGPLGAAIREAFEEVGVLLAAPLDAPGEIVATDGESWMAGARAAVHEGRARMAEVLAARGLAIAAAALVPFARWITPSSEARRYDAHFYLARMPRGQTAIHDAVETIDHRWAPPQLFLDEGRRGAIQLPPPTQWHLTDLSDHQTVDAALAWARARDTAPIAPKLVPVVEPPASAGAAGANTIAVVLPWDPEFPSLPGEGEPTAAPGGTDPAPVTRFVLVDGRWDPRRPRARPSR